MNKIFFDPNLTKFKTSQNWKMDPEKHENFPICYHQYQL